MTKSELTKIFPTSENFSKIISLILELEGGYVFDQNDPGGETKYGISKKSYPELDIKHLTIDEAKTIYFRDFWLKIRADEFNGPLKYLLFDSAINQGRSGAIKILQKTLGANETGLLDDQLISKSNRRSGVHIQFTSYRIDKYRNTNNVDLYFRGWVKRTLKVFEKSLII
jgi:lysozyme family protein